MIHKKETPLNKAYKANPHQKLYLSLKLVIKYPITI